MRGNEGQRSETHVKYRDLGVVCHFAGSGLMIEGRKVN